MMQQMMMCGMCDGVKPCRTMNNTMPQKEDMQVEQVINGFPKSKKRFRILKLIQYCNATPEFLFAISRMNFAPSASILIVAKGFFKNANNIPGSVIKNSPQQKTDMIREVRRKSINCISVAGIFLNNILMSSKWAMQKVRHNLNIS